MQLCYQRFELGKHATKDLPLDDPSYRSLLRYRLPITMSAMIFMNLLAPVISLVIQAEH